jgi:hypothetical protein
LPNDSLSTIVFCGAGTDGCGFEEGAADGFAGAAAGFEAGKFPRFDPPSDAFFVI